MASVQLQYVESYSRSFSQYVCREAFETKAHLEGQDLLALTPVQQVNYFVLKALYRAWQQEILRIESPYFDYKEAAVRKALHVFMNALSKHIRIGEEDLAPLLEQACKDTLVLLLSPQDFFYQELVVAPQVLSLTYLRNTQKYVRINTHVMSVFQTYFDREDLPEISSERASELLELCAPEYASGEKVQTYLSEFNTFLPLPDDLFSQESATENSEEAKQRDISSIEARSIEEHRAIDEKTSSSVASKTIKSPVSAEATISPSRVSKDQSRGAGRSFSHISRTQADNFTRFLFNNKRQLFLQALKEVSNSENFDKAVEMLRQSYGKPQGWRMESSEGMESSEVRESSEVKEFFRQIFLFFR